MSIAMLLLLATLGMAFDFGRIYIARNEAQLFTDAAALVAVRSLDGSGSGVERAREAVAKLPNRWNLGTQKFEAVAVEFSADAKDWSNDPDDVSVLAYARVTAPDNAVNITFLRAVGGPESFTVPARSVAAMDPVRLIQ
jgi:Flp pilus assembly protein TadG